MGVHGKIWVLEEGFTKNQYIGGDCLKRGFGQFADLRQGGLARKKVFLSGGGWHPNAHYAIQTNFVFLEN